MIRLCALFLLLGLVAPAFGDDAPPDKSILLVARKNLPDPFFRDSVVLITNYGGTAPFGVIVNRPTEITLASVLPDIERLRGRDEKLFFGGPVRPEGLLVVFRAATPPANAIKLFDDVYMSSNREVLRELLGRESPVEGLRVFAGHAGWAPGQLEAEIERSDWHLAPADVKTLFEKKPGSLWPELERKASAIMAHASAPQ
jgi:putative transcriptional regulator